MKWHSLALFALLSACAHTAAHQNDIASAQNACRAGASHAEVVTSGIVESVLDVRRGPSGNHEGFMLSVGSALYRIEDNIDLTGYIPLRRGERVELMGQFECNDGVIHWTHHDPAGRHPSGYVSAGGRTYQ